MFKCLKCNKEFKYESKLKAIYKYLFSIDNNINDFRFNLNKFQRENPERFFQTLKNAKPEKNLKV